MRKIYLIVGSIICIASYFWYTYVVNNYNMLYVFSPDFISRPQFIPLTVGIIGAIILITGLVKDEPIKYNHVAYNNPQLNKELEQLYRDR